MFFKGIFESVESWKKEKYRNRREFIIYNCFELCLRLLWISFSRVAI